MRPDPDFAAALRPDFPTAFAQRYADPHGGRHQRHRDELDVGRLAHILHRRRGYVRIRYTGADDVPDQRRLTFFATSDDGSALYIDGVMVFHDWVSAGEHSGAVVLTARIRRSGSVLRRRR